MEKKNNEAKERRSWEDNCDESYFCHFIYSYIILINVKISKKNM